MLSFCNKGEIDFRLVQIFGASIKPTDSHIGMFGTGLKHAIATVLRNEGTVQMWSGLRGWDFTLTPQEIRGETVQVVVAIPLPGYEASPSPPLVMPFTSDCGKNWKPWMAYREFYANALDEGGEVVPGSVAPSADKTVIKVMGLDEVYAHRDDYFLDKSQTCAFSTNEVEIHLSPGNGIFYQGILASETPKPGLFTYNLLEQHDLTEDRTLRYSTTAVEKILRTIAKAPESVMRAVLLAGKESWEWSSLGWGSLASEDDLPEKFVEVVKDICKTREHDLPYGLVDTLRALGKGLDPDSFEPTADERQMVSDAAALLAKAGYTIDTTNIFYARSLGFLAYGKAQYGRTYICRQAFDEGLSKVAEVLLEEHLHNTKAFVDCTRRFQNYLMGEVVRLAWVLREGETK